MEIDKNNPAGSPAVNLDADVIARRAAIRNEQQANLQRVPQSGTVSFYTAYDCVLMFNAAALMKGISYIGKVTVPCPEEVLRGRKLAVNEEVNVELMPLLDKLIEAGGAISLEQRRDMLDHIVDSVYVLLGLAANLGLPFDLGFAIVHDANMKKLFMEGAPIFNENGKVMKPEGWQPPEMQLFEVLRRAYAMEMKANPQVANNLPDPKGTNETDQVVGTPTVNTVANDTPVVGLGGVDQMTPESKIILLDSPQ